jgi:hypothetical protein
MIITRNINMKMNMANNGQLLKDKCNIKIKMKRAYKAN